MDLKTDQLLAIKLNDQVYLSIRTIRSKNYIPRYFIRELLRSDHDSKSRLLSKE